MKDEELIEEDLNKSGSDSLSSFDDFDSSFDNFDMVQNPPMSKYGDLLKELTNFDPIIQRRIRNWLGLEWDDKVQTYKPKNQAIINIKGAKWVIGCLETYQSKTNIITNLGREEYISMKLEILDLAWIVFPCKFEEFEIKDSPDQYRLSNELQHSAFLVLAGAGDGKYTKFLGETHTVHENISANPTNYQNNNSNRGFFDSLKSRLLGRK